MRVSPKSNPHHFSRNGRQLARQFITSIRDTLDNGVDTGRAEGSHAQPSPSGQRTDGDREWQVLRDNSQLVYECLPGTTPRPSLDSESSEEPCDFCERQGVCRESTR